MLLNGCLISFCLKDPVVFLQNVEGCFMSHGKQPSFYSNFSFTSPCESGYVRLIRVLYHFYRTESVYIFLKSVAILPMAIELNMGIGGAVFQTIFSSFIVPYALRRCAIYGFPAVPGWFL